MSPLLSRLRASNMQIGAWLSMHMCCTYIMHACSNQGSEREATQGNQCNKGRSWNHGAPTGGLPPSMN